MAVDTQYDVGEEIPLSFDYRVSGALVDPGTLALHLVSPAGLANVDLVYPADIDKTADGQFFYGFRAPGYGWWKFYWEADIPIPVVVQGEFYVKRLPGTTP